MDRRTSIKTLIVGSVATGTLVEACKLADKKKTGAEENAAPASSFDLNRMPEEAEHFRRISAEKFFTESELATIAVLADIIIPRDEVSGSATDAKVPEFIEFIVKDKPELQTPVRGGLRWLDVHCLNRYQAAFKDCNKAQQMETVDEIAWPGKAKPEFGQGVSFFNLMRNLTATGFYTSQIGVKDIGYMGNTPNQWNGVPADVLKQYGLSYSERELKECVNFDVKS